MHLIEGFLGKMTQELRASRGAGQTRGHVQRQHDILRELQMVQTDWSRRDTWNWGDRSLEKYTG